MPQTYLLDAFKSQLAHLDDIPDRATLPEPVDEITQVTTVRLRHLLLHARPTTDSELMLLTFRQCPIQRLVRAGLSSNPFVSDALKLVQLVLKWELKWKARIRIDKGVFLYGKLPHNPSYHMREADSTLDLSFSRWQVSRTSWACLGRARSSVDTATRTMVWLVQGSWREIVWCIGRQRVSHYRPLIFTCRQLILAFAISILAITVHPGDIQHARAVAHPDLIAAGLRNVVVFSTKGRRDLPNQSVPPSRGTPLPLLPPT